MVVYFSGTGNSKYVAERIAGSLQEKLLCMNERIKYAIIAIAVSKISTFLVESSMEVSFLI